MSLELKLIEYQIRTHKKSPVFLSKLLTSTYYKNYFLQKKDHDSFEELIFDFYIQHYGGKDLNKEKSFWIIDECLESLSMLLFCIYIHEISNDSEMMSLCLKNIPGVYLIILEIHNKFCPINNREEFDLTKDKAHMLIALTL